MIDVNSITDLSLRGIVEKITDKTATINDVELRMIAAYIARQQYTLDDKPNFKYADYVEVDTGKWSPGGDVQTARIVGKSSEGVLDFWLCEFNRDFAPSYPYKVVAVQHTFIIKYGLPDKLIRLDDGEVFVKNAENRYELQLMQPYKQNGHYIHSYGIHTLMVVHSGKFIDEFVFNLLREHRPQDLQKLVYWGGGNWTV